MREAMESNTPIVMSLGEGCARKVALSIVYAFPEPYTYKLIAVCTRFLP